MDTIEPGRSFGLWVILARILNPPQLRPAMEQAVQAAQRMRDARQIEREMRQYQRKPAAYGCGEFAR